jgi:hypothetical protein
MFKKILITISIFGMIFSTNYTEQEKMALDQEAMQKMMAEIFREAMKVKREFQANQVREEIIENLASTAPREEFIVNADLSSELAESNPSATIYISTDGQESWTNSENIGPLNEPGFETTWGTTVNTAGGDEIDWYLSGLVNSEVLGYDYGTMIVSQSPNKMDGGWPISDNYFAILATDDAGETNSGQDIVGMYGSYSGEGTDINEIYVKLSLDGGCCSEGSLFGPWYLYGVGIVNPESESAIAYAIGYGNGGFGQLSPGLLKLSGDLATGDIAGFEYITTNINYSTDGNDMTASVLMDYITNDADFGEWPNSIQGVVTLGVTVSASLAGASVDANLQDQTNPGFFMLTTQSQTGNNEPNITDGSYDDETKTMSVTYQDDDGNLPWFKAGQVCFSGTSNCFVNLDLTPDSHAYSDGVNYLGSIMDEDIASGDYDIKFWFEDDDEIGEPQIVIPVTIGGSCGLNGDVNGDNNVNVVDVVVIVNHVLENTTDPCADLSGDGLINVVDIVQLVNIILGD